MADDCPPKPRNFIHIWRTCRPRHPTQLANRQTGQQTNFSQYDYTYDKVGNRRTKVTSSGTEGYAYDKIYQLTNVTYPDTSAKAYNYDPLGNRTSTVNGGTTNYTSNNLNQYSQVGVSAYTYDANGNLASNATSSYSYDNENRLVSATTPSHTASYTYDPFGRRITKTVDGTTTKYLYDDDQIIAEYDGSDNMTAKYVYGAEIDEPIRVEKGGTNYYYHYDGLGSITTLTDSTGSTAESYSYDAFGTPSATSAIGNRYMFTGREYDAETGLYYYRARSYSPGIGRFNQTDPLGMSEGTNLYTYVGNNPINRVDPYGLTSIPLSGSGIDIPGWNPGRVPGIPPVVPVTPPTPGGITNHPAQPGDIVYEDDDVVVTLVDIIYKGKDRNGRPIYIYVYRIYNKKTGETTIVTKRVVGEEEPEPEDGGEDGGDNKCKK